MATKFFTFHDSLDKVQSNRPYFTKQWEALLAEQYKLPSFQFTMNTSDYVIYHVQNGTETDISSYFDGLMDFHGSFAIYNGAILKAYLPKGKCYFHIADGVNDYYSNEVEILDKAKWVTGWSTFDNVTFNGIEFQTNEVATLTSNNFNTTLGENITILIDWDVSLYPSGFQTARLYYSDGSYTAFSASTYGNFNKWTVTTEKSGVVYIKFINLESDIKTDYINIFKDYSEDYISFRFSQDVDFAGIYYKGGFTQTWYKKATVQRSKEHNTIQIGSERQGKFVNEKTISRIKYNIHLKISEDEYEALVTNQSCDVAIIDQTGTTFTCYGIEIQNPAWNRANGICIFSFFDNINTFTENQTDL